MPLSKKDYEVIAAGIRDAKEIEAGRHAAEMEGMRKVAEVLCAKFALNHTTFNPRRFMEACGFDTLGVLNKERKDG